MRECDVREIFGLQPDTPPAVIAAQAVQADSVVLKYRDRPVAVIASRLIVPHWLEVWAFATDDWPRVALTATKYVKRHLVPGFLQAGVHRAECRALADNGGTCRWLEACGARPEALLRDCGPDRLDFILYAWRRQDFETALS